MFEFVLGKKIIHNSEQKNKMKPFFYFRIRFYCFESNIKHVFFPSLLRRSGIVTVERIEQRQKIKKGNT